MAHHILVTCLCDPSPFPPLLPLRHRWQESEFVFKAGMKMGKMMSVVAEEVGVSASAIHHYFHGKRLHAYETVEAVRTIDIVCDACLVRRWSGMCLHVVTHRGV